MQVKIIMKTKALINELYYAQNFSMIGWSKSTATTKTEPRVTRANRWMALLSQKGPS